MKKKIIVLTVALAMVLSIAACGGSVETNKEQNSNIDIISGSTVESSEIIDENTTDADINSTVEDTSSIGTGSLLDLTEDEQEKEVRKHTAIIIDAIKNLDFETLEPYLDSDDIEDIREGIERLKNNSDDVDFWNKTVGTIVYFENSDVLLHKSVRYTVAAWYTDCWKNNVDIPEDASADFSNEYLEEIYNKYYKDAPYEAVYNVSNAINVSINDEGKIKFWPHITGNIELDLLLESITTDYTNMRAAVLMAEGDCYGLGYEYIADPKNNPDYKLFMEKDLDVIMSRAIEIGVVDLEASMNIITHAYKSYFMDEANKAAIQSFLNSQCTVLRGLTYVYIFAPVNTEETFPYNALTKEDRAMLNSMNFNLVRVISFSEFNEDENDFMFFNDLSNSAIENGIVEFISMF